MNKTLILLLAFLVLGVGAYFLLSDKGNSSSVDLTFDTKFTVDDIDEVHKIFIADRRGSQTTLIRDGNYWRLADGARVRKYPIGFILNCLQNLEYKYLLSKPEGDYAVKRMAVSGIKVEVYDKENENLLTFYVGPNSGDHEGSYMMKEGSDKPQIMNLPGHVGELRTIFEMSGDEWKDRTVYDLNKSDIKSIEIHYPKQVSKSFRLSLDGEDAKVLPLDKYADKLKTNLNQAVVDVFLEEFESKIAESFKNNMRGDSALMTLPFAIVKIEKISGETDELKFVPLVSFKTGSTGVPIAGKSNMLRYYTIREGGDIYFTQHHVMQGIFRSYDSFF